MKQSPVTKIRELVKDVAITTENIKKNKLGH